MLQSRLQDQGWTACSKCYSPCFKIRGGASTLNVSLGLKIRGGRSTLNVSLDFKIRGGRSTLNVTVSTSRSGVGHLL